MTEEHPAVPDEVAAAERYKINLAVHQGPAPAWALQMEQNLQNYFNQRIQQTEQLFTQRLQQAGHNLRQQIR